MFDARAEYGKQPLVRIGDRGIKSLRLIRFGVFYREVEVAGGVLRRFFIREGLQHFKVVFLFADRVYGERQANLINFVDFDRRAVYDYLARFYFDERFVFDRVA